MSSCITNSDGTTPVIPTGWSGSTYLNSAMQTYSDVAFRIKSNLGYPAVAVEATDSQIATFIDQAIEVYTKYAGFTKEPVVFCTNRYIPGCGINVGEMFATRCSQTCVTTVTSEEVTSTAVDYIPVATTVSLVSSWGAPASSTVCITYDPDNIWAFSPCSATHVLITATTATPTDISLCGPVSGLIAIKNGVATIYPYTFATLSLDPCAPLSAYWGCDISDATSVKITNVPPCTVGGLQALTFNNGKVATVTICNTALDTHGPIPAWFEWVQSYQAPEALYGLYELPDTSSFFRICIPVSACLPNTSTWTYVETQFLSASSTPATGIVVRTCSANYDHDLDAIRRVLSVVTMDRMGTFGGLGEGVLYGMDYAIAQNLWQGSSLTTNVQGFGFDFTTYELMAQYVEMAKRMMARSYEIHFNPDTQMLRFFPEPPRNETGTECVENCRDICFVAEMYIEKPVRSLLKERWILNYALALTMISLGHVRGKFGQVQLFGGGSLNGNDMLTSGQALLEKMETELLNNYGDSPPPAFFVG